MPAWAPIRVLRSLPARPSGLMSSVVSAGVAIVAVVAILVVALTGAVRENQDAKRWSARSAVVLSTAQLAERHVVDLETGLRGYEATGRRLFLAPWSAARLALPEDLATLRRLADGPVQRRRAGELRTAINSYITTYTVPFVARARPLSGEALIAFTGHGKALLDSLRVRFDQFDRTERALQANRDRSSASRDRVWEAIGAIAALVLVLAVVVLVLLLARRILVPLRRVSAMCKRLADGEPDVRAPAGHSGELGQLGRAFNDMAGRLSAQEQELRQSLKQLEGERDYAAAITSSMHEGFLLTRDGVILDVNRALCELTGFQREELLGRRVPYPFWAPEAVEEIARQRKLIRRDHAHEFEVTYRRKDGTRFDAAITAAIASAGDGTTLGYVSTVRDVSERNDYEAELRRRATHDPLTGLANHRVFHERLVAECARADRQGQPLSVALIDLDKFKRVNDRYGHPAGDGVLIEAAARLKALVREGDLLARVGGEEFAWLLNTNALGAVGAAERARHAISTVPFPDVGTVTLSAGVCDLNAAGTSVRLYEQADRAMYLAKQHGRNRTVRYTRETAHELTLPGLTAPR